MLFVALMCDPDIFLKLLLCSFHIWACQPTMNICYLNATLSLPHSHFPSVAVATKFLDRLQLSNLTCPYTDYKLRGHGPIMLLVHTENRCGEKVL